MKRHAARLTLAIVATLSSLAFLAPSALAAAEAPQISGTAVSAITETTATLQATVDPGEKKTEYHFLYINQAGFEAGEFAGAIQAPVPDGSIPASVTGTGDLTGGSAEVTDLTTTAGTFGPGQSISGAGIPAETTILAVEANKLKLSHSAGAGGLGVALTATGPQPVSVPISGLQPGTTYHYRLIAHNSKSPPGGTEGPEATFATYSSPSVFGRCPANETFRVGPSVGLPDCRAYEQVSPVDKNGGDLTGPVPFVKAAIGGGAVTFLSSTGVPVSDPSLSGSQELPLYLGSRGEGGWSTQGLLPPADAGQGAQVIGWLPDFSESFDVAESFAGKPRPRALFGRPTDGGALTPIAPYTPGAEYQFAGATADGSEVVFEMATRDLAGHLGTSTVYAWNRAGGGLSPVSVDNEDQPVSAKGAFAGPYDWVRGTNRGTLGEGGSARRYYTQDEHAVAADGAVYFTAAGTGQLYLRRNPTEEQSPLNGAGECTNLALACTIQVSASERTIGPDTAGPAPAAFMAASGNGLSALFTSSEKLTDDATTGPEPPAPTIGRANAADGSGKEEAFLAAAAGGVAVDGSHIYWVDSARDSIGRAKLGATEAEEIEPEFIPQLEVEVEVEPGVFESVPGNPQYVAVDAEHVYWTNATNGEDEHGTIGRAKLGATEAEEIEPEFITEASNPQGIAVDAEHVYWANVGSTNPTRSIGRAAIGGGEANQDFIDIEIGNRIPQGVAVDGGHVYWTSNEEQFAYIQRAGLGGSEIKGAFIGERVEARGIAVDAGHLYWATQAGAIGRANLDLSGVEEKFVETTGRLKGVAVDASHLYWSANGELSANPGNDLYRFEAEQPAGQRLTDLSVDQVDADGAEVQGVLGASEDGSYVYFAANGDLTGAEENANHESATTGDCSGHLGSAASGTCNLYLFHAGQVSFIAQLDVSGAKSSDAFDWSASPTHLIPGNEDLQKTAFVSSDGRTLLFRSQRKLTDYENEGIPEFYRYRAGDSGPTCVSCNPTGAPPTGTPTLGTIIPTALTPPIPASVASRNLSASGDRVFFETTDALVSADTNGEEGCPTVGTASQQFRACQDVYEWEADGSGSCRGKSEDGGCLYLLSTGKSDYASFFADASASGADAFIFTRSQLVGQDKDELLDVYDAREDGGLAAQSQPASSLCEGEACKAGAKEPPAFQSPATPSFNGPGNESEAPKCKKGSVKKNGKCVKKPKKKPHKKHHRRRAGHNRGGRK